MVQQVTGVFFYEMVTFMAFVQGQEQLDLGELKDIHEAYSYFV